MSELRKLREAVYDLATDEDEVLTDEAWYERLWELLDPVIDARAERQLAVALNAWRDLDDVPTHDAGEYRDPSTGETQWAGSSTTTPPPHVDTSEFEDPDNG